MQTTCSLPRERGRAGVGAEAAMGSPRFFSKSLFSGRSGNSHESFPDPLHPRYCPKVQFRKREPATNIVAPGGNRAVITKHHQIVEVLMAEELASKER